MIVLYCNLTYYINMLDGDHNEVFSSSSAVFFCLYVCVCVFMLCELGE